MPILNKGARKETSVYFPTSFVYHVDSEMPTWNRGHTIEYAKVRDYYDRMGKGDLTEIDLHEGGHIINVVKSYPFLHKHMDWPEP